MGWPLEVMGWAASVSTTPASSSPELCCAGTAHHMQHTSSPTTPSPSFSPPQVLPQADRVAIASELTEHALRCVRDQNGNHVIQASGRRGVVLFWRCLCAGAEEFVCSRAGLTKCETDLTFSPPHPLLPLQKCIECVQPSDPARAMIEVRDQLAYRCLPRCAFGHLPSGYSPLLHPFPPTPPPPTSADHCVPGAGPVHPHLWLPPGAARARVLLHR